MLHGYAAHVRSSIWSLTDRSSNEKRKIMDGSLSSPPLSSSVSWDSAVVLFSLSESSQRICSIAIITREKEGPEILSSLASLGGGCSGWLGKWWSFQKGESTERYSYSRDATLSRGLALYVKGHKVGFACKFKVRWDSEVLRF